MKQKNKTSCSNKDKEDFHDSPVLKNPACEKQRMWV